jgi:hypothetical protein
MSAAAGIVILDAAEGPPLAIVEGDGSAHAVVWPGSGAQLRSLARVRLGAGARTTSSTAPAPSPTPRPARRDRWWRGR